MKSAYGISVLNIPWYIKCPILNRLVDTAVIEMTAETFNDDGSKKGELQEKCRIPIEGRDLDWKAYIHLLFHFSGDNVGEGLLLRTTVTEVNRRPLTKSLDTTLWVRKEGSPIWTWEDAFVELKLGKKDLAERGAK